MKARTPAELSGTTGRAYWRSLDELADTPEFREYLEREFPDNASVLSEESRRDFLKLMGGSLALAGALTIQGCRRPDHKILTFNKDPEHVVPGNPMYYATAMPMPGGGAQGLLAKTYTGRPVKLEGNPLHPVSRGKTDIFAQAAILDLYDPERAKEVRGPKATDTWATFEAWAGAHFAKFDATGGEGLVFLVEKVSSPSRDAMRDRALRRWKNAKWLPYEPIDDVNAIEGSRLAFGAPQRERLALEKAKVIVSIDRDVLGEPGAVEESRGFAAGRRVHGKASDAEMSRLYAVESMMTLTGGAADHRLRLKPSEIQGVAMALAAKTLERLGGAGDMGGALARADAGAHAEWVDAAAEDLAAHKGAAVVLVGESQAPGVHALFHAVNAALGAVGGVATYRARSDEESASSLESITTLAKAMEGGRVDTLVVVGCNPVFDAPADLEFGVRYAKVPTTVRLGASVDETGALSTWHVNRAHFLETWGDVVAADGTPSVIQPTIAPLFGGKSELEFLAAIVKDEAADGYAIVRRTWRDRLGGDGAGFEKAWRRALHDGFLPGSPAKSAARINPGAIGAAVAALRAPASSEGGLLEAVFVGDPRLHDGRFANNAWMQETPHQITKVTWDNPALLSPATARRLKIENGGAVTIGAGGSRTISTVAWVQPGLADDTVVLTLGSGRTECGRIGREQGFNVYPLRTTGAMRTGAGFVVNPKSGPATDKAYASIVACTQNHHSMEGRPIVREVDLPAWRKFGDEVFDQKDPYGATRHMNFASAIGDESHTPANRDVYLKEQGHPFETGPEAHAHTGRQGAVYPSGMQQWGMSVDLTTCTGCGTCITACQAENNIPVVGKAEVSKGREMSWMRVDRYYSGDENAPETLTQPVMCVHCENAPCETVCPVNATIHSPEGTNDMAYNRCIGTRYCSNNCPYKVRRFNWFDYATKQLHGDFGQLGKGIPNSWMPRNEHFVPPRLREKVNQLKWLQHNPNVTVRSRGVMEKCTYCIQRINRARVETKASDLRGIPDGFFETACQQACPTESIVFGDISDANSRVSALRGHGRTYMLLAYLNTRPRTTYMMRIRNPNPRLVDAARKASWEHSPLDHGAGHDEGGHGEPADHGAAKPAGHVMSLPVLRGDTAGAGRRGALANIVAGALS